MNTKNSLAVFLISVFLCLLQSCSGGSNESKSNQDFVSQEAQLFFKVLKSSNSKVEDKQGNEIPAEKITIERTWNGNICKTILKNTSDENLYPKDVILFNIPKHGFNPDA
jgi:alpha-galactosidase